MRISSVGTGNYQEYATLWYLGKKRKIVAKVVCVLYKDPVGGYPKSYARDDVPKIKLYPDGQTLPTPEAIDFEPGTLLGSVSGKLGLRKFLEERGHTLVVTSDKDGTDSVFERELADAEAVISQPFWPAYLTAERIAKAKNLKLAITAGIGSDHVDLQAAGARDYGRRDHLLQQHQHGGACGDDDPRARA
jgi:formate dehydrogenase